MNLRRAMQRLRRVPLIGTPLLLLRAALRRTTRWYRTRWPIVQVEYGLDDAMRKEVEGYLSAEGSKARRGLRGELKRMLQVPGLRIVDPPPRIMVYSVERTPDGDRVIRFRQVCVMDAEEVFPDEIELPPCSRLRVVLAFLFSRRTMQRIFDEPIDDLQGEWVDAVAARNELKARWIRIRGYWSILVAVSSTPMGRRVLRLAALASLGRVAWTLWEAAK